MTIYMPPDFSNLDMLFNEVTHSLCEVSLRVYKNFIIMGDFNINVNTTGAEVDKNDEFCNIFDITNLIKIETCCTKSYKSTIDLLLTNRPGY